MRASKAHMEKIHNHILESSEQGFREEGYSGLGINGLVKRAGLTSGAFYGHFSSKKQAFYEVVEHGMENYIRTIKELQTQHKEDWPQQFLDFYLSQKHVDDLTHSCVVPALSADIMRSDKEIKSVFSDQLEEVVKLISNGVDEMNKPEAWALVSLLAGSVMIARCASSQEQSSEILEAARMLADSIVSSEK